MSATFSVLSPLYKTHHNLISSTYRDALKQNMSNYMFILFCILDNCSSNGEIFLEQALLEPNYKYFNYSYSFNKLGEIVRKEDRHFTGRNEKETERYKRIAFEAVYEYNDKENRNTKPYLSTSEIQLLNNLCRNIANGSPVFSCKSALIQLVEIIENRIISSL